MSEGSEGLPKGLNDLTEGSEGLLEGMDRLMYGRTEFPPILQGPLPKKEKMEKR